jgi:hypothetical protein
LREPELVGKQPTSGVQIGFERFALLCLLLHHQRSEATERGPASSANP